MKVQIVEYRTGNSNYYCVGLLINCGCDKVLMIPAEKVDEFSIKFNEDIGFQSKITESGQIELSLEQEQVINNLLSAKKEVISLLQTVFNGASARNNRDRWAD